MKIILRGTFLLMLLAVVGTALIAQDNAMAQKPGAAKPAMPPSMPMPKPAPEMTKLIKLLAGNWMITEKAEPNPMAPKGGSGTGTAKLWAGPGGLSLLESYHSSGTAMGPNFNGFGVFWWDDKVQAYHGLWCDTMTPGGCDSSGTTKWQGDNLVGTMESDMNGQKTVATFTYSDWKPDSFVMTMAMGPDANSLKKFMTITYTKSSGMGKPGKPAQ